MVTMQSEAETCSLSGRRCVSFTEGPLPNAAQYHLAQSFGQFSMGGGTLSY